MKYFIFFKAEPLFHVKDHVSTSPPGGPVALESSPQDPQLHQLHGPGLRCWMPVPLRGAARATPPRLSRGRLQERLFCLKGQQRRPDVEAAGQPASKTKPWRAGARGRWGADGGCGGPAKACDCGCQGNSSQKGPGRKEQLVTACSHLDGDSSWLWGRASASELVWWGEEDKEPVSSNRIHGAEGPREDTGHQTGKTWSSTEEGSAGQ